MESFDELSELLKRLGLPPIDELEPDPAKQPAFAERLAKEFEALAEADKEGDRGGYKIRVGNIHVQLSRSAWPLLELIGKLTFAAVKHSGMDAGAAVFTFVVKARALIGKLDQTERFLYESVAAISEKNAIPVRRSLNRAQARTIC